MATADADTARPLLFLFPQNVQRDVIRLYIDERPQNLLVTRGTQLLLVHLLNLVGIRQWRLLMPPMIAALTV